MKSDEHYMRLALKQAEKAAAIGEVPIGCVIVCDGKIVGRGYNKRNKNKTTLAHAELIAIDKASRKLGDWRLEGCTMYVTLEPCQMCAGALVQARIDRVVIGAMNAKAGCAGSILNLLQMPQFNHQVELTTGVLQEECQSILKAFFKDLRVRVKREKEEKQEKQEALIQAEERKAEERKAKKKMEKRKMENLGVETSLLGFGCMRFPTQADGSIDEAQTERMLAEALAQGVNYIDTAYPYHDGKSELVVGKILKKYDRDSFFLATKLPLWLVNTVEDVDRFLLEQLEKLQIDYIDFYLLHCLDKERWEKMKEIGCVERLEKWQAEGKIRYLGFSFHDSYEVFEDILNARDWDFCQIQLNYMDTQEQAGIRGYQLAERKGVPLVIMEPVKGGSLATFSEDIMEKFRRLDAGASAASFALRWVGSLPGVKVILSGMSTMEQVQDNVKTFRDFRPLSAEEQRVIDEVTATLESRVQNGCTGCGYCMPCPAGVDIPGNFKAWNTYHMYQNYRVVKGNWEVDLVDKQAKKCVKCGKCEELCPQKLFIREDLEKVQADLDQKEWIAPTV